MGNIIDSLKMISLYNRLRTNIIVFIIVPIIALPGILYAEPITSKDYMYPIAFTAVSLIIFIFGLNNSNRVLASKKFIFSSKVAKSMCTVANIVYTNILGIGFICIVAITRYILVIFKIGNMDNIADTLFVLFIVLAFTSFLKAIMTFYDIIALVLAAPLALLVVLAAKYSFTYFKFRETIFSDNAALLILAGMILYMAINAVSVLYSSYLYENRKGMGSGWISSEE